MSNRRIWTLAVLVGLVFLVLVWARPFTARSIASAVFSHSYDFPIVFRTIDYYDPTGGFHIHNTWYRFEWHLNQRVRCAYMDNEYVAILKPDEWELIESGTVGCDGNWHDDFVYPYTYATVRDKRTGKLWQVQYNCLAEAMWPAQTKCDGYEVIDVTNIK